MAIAHARRITVDDVEFQWKFLGHRENLMGWSPRVGRIVVCYPMTGAIFLSELFHSKRWDHAYDGQEDNAPQHKATLYPQDVEKIIRVAFTLGWDLSTKGRFVVPVPDLVDYGPIA